MSAQPDAGQRFIEALTRGLGPRRLSEQLERWVGAVFVASSPTGHLATEFGEFLASHIRDADDPGEALRAVHVEELLLAFRCARGDNRAIAELERQYGGHLQDVIGTIADHRFSNEDLWQIVRAHLYAPTDGREPAIARYGGRGAFAAWLRVTAKRAALNATRRKELPREDNGDDAVVQLAEAMGDPELRFLKERYRDAFRAAFGRGFQTLATRERALVRYAVRDGLGVRDIGRIYDVHHATAARWVAAAYQSLVAATRREMAVILSTDDQEIGSILSLIKSRLDATLEHSPAADEPT